MRRSLFAIPLLAMVLVLGTSCVDPDAPVDPTDTAEFEFEVPKGSSAKGLGPVLLEQGLVPSELKWKLFLRQEDGSCLKAGKFLVRRSMSMRELLTTLCGPPLPDDVAFTVVEGWRIREIDAALAEKGWIEPGAYAELATSKAVDLPFEVTSPTLEGYLYPETYRVHPPPRFTPEDLIERQLATFDERFLSKHPDGFGGRTLHDVVVMASMLEREEPKPAQRPMTAGILWKRLDNGWQLGVDATSRYELPDWNDKKAFLTHLRDPDDPYNTRLRHGLPPTAIGNPDASSLEAAVAPEPSEYWYYLHDSTGTFHGARNGDEHDANRRKYDVY